MQVLAVHRHDSSLEFCLISYERKEIRIEFLEPLDTEKVSDISKETLKYRHCGLNGKRVDVVAGLPADQIFIRQIHLPVRNLRALNKALPFQIDAVIPFASRPGTDVVVTKKKALSGGYLITPYAFMHTHLEKLLAGYQETALDPDWVSCIPQALKRFAAFFVPKVSSLLVCFADQTETHLISLIDGKIDVALTLHTSFFCGGQNEIARSIAYALQREGGGQIEGVLQLGDVVFQSTDLGIRSIEIENSTVYDPKRLKERAIEIGLGLDVVLHDAETVQLRRGGSVSKIHLASAKWLTQIFTGTLAACLLVLWTSSHLTLSARRKNLVQRLQQAVDFEVDHIASTDGWDEAIAKARKSLKKKGVAVGFHKKPPQVVELLQWLNTHPNLQEGIRIERLAYSLEKYPSIKSPLDGFKVKVDLTFQADSPLVARDFHQSLTTQKNEQIDGKEAIHWERSDSGYRAVFYLQNPIKNRAG